MTDPPDLDMTLLVNGERHDVTLDPRTTVLDALRHRLALTGTKKGCDQGACGACTVHVAGRRVLSCLMLAVQADGLEIKTIEGVGTPTDPHPMQQAFMDHDAFQWGYCTPGQVMSALALIGEGRAGDDAEIREFMSGNLCRCGAYPHIVDAIREVGSGAAGIDRSAGS